jgi:hypothetical protein
MTLRKLYEWAVVKSPFIAFGYCIVKEHRKETKMVEEKFRKA